MRAWKSGVFVMDRAELTTSGALTKIKRFFVENIPASLKELNIA